MERIETLRILERDALLARLRASLEADSRVVAAWLHGSLGCREGDGWSDLDLWVVVADEAYSDAIRHEFAGGALFTEEAPQNGPAGGTYLMAAHDAPTGPHLVDWYFQPLRFASRGEARAMLIERASLPETPQPASPNAELQGTPNEDAANKAALFWAMVLVQAKYVARKPVEDGMGFEGFLLSLLRDVASQKGTPIDEAETPGLRLASEKLDRLKSLGERLAVIAPELAVPWDAVGRFLQTVRRAVV